VFLLEWFPVFFCRGSLPVSADRLFPQQTDYQRIRPASPIADPHGQPLLRFRRRGGAKGRVQRGGRLKNWPMLQKWLTIEPLRRGTIRNDRLLTGTRAEEFFGLRRR